MLAPNDDTEAVTVNIFVEIKLLSWDSKIIDFVCLLRAMAKRFKSNILDAGMYNY